MFFSPDGKYLAYDLRVGDSSQQRDVFVLAVDGSRETPVVVHPATDIVVGWSPDNSRLLFSSDRSGAVGLWSLAISNGRPQGLAELIKPELGRGWSLGLTTSGALYFGARVDGPDVQIASVDFSTGQSLSPPVNPIPNYIGSNLTPEWSRDGRFLAYASRRDALSGNPLIGILSLETGRVRELRPELNNFRYNEAPSWSPDGRFLAVIGGDLKGRQGILRIDTQNGQVSPIALSQEREQLNGTDWSPDGKKIYYRRATPPPSDPAFIERDLASGSERVVIQRRSLGALNLSPDGQWIATPSQDDSTKSSTLILIPVFGGEPREVFRVALPDRQEYPSWAPDSSFIIVRKRLSAGNGGFEYWQIPISGAEPRKLNLNLNLGNNGWMSLHPDGHQVAYSSGTNRYEVWVLENFLPAAPARGGRP